MPNLSRFFVVAQPAKADKLRPVIRIETRYGKEQRPLGEALPANGFLVSPAGFESLEIARPGNPRLAVVD
jgi:hypothetical protein